MAQVGDGQGRACGRDTGTMNKFRAKPQVIDGIRFDSKKEAKRWAELCLLQRQGEIADLQRQVPIMLEGRDGPLLTKTGRKMRMTLDFSYTDTKTGLTVYEDAKGMETRDFLVRNAVAAAQGVKVNIV